MSTPIQKIKNLLKYIPEKDMSYTTKFMNNRDFESLRELVKSDIQILKRKKDESLEARIESLEMLKAEIDSYMMLIGFDEDDTETDFWTGEI